MKKALNPAQVLIIGFLSFITIGAVFLLLPFSTTQGISVIDALFTSTSAVCVTGLIVKNTAADFTVIGQIIILLLIQVGGLGYMTSATIISLMIGKKIGLGERLIMKDALNVGSIEGIVKFTKAVLFITLIFEILGASLLSLRFMADYPALDAFFYGLFHSVSAFNNAGFSLFPNNLIPYRGNVLINLVITSLIIGGGIGFLFMNDLYNYARKRVPRISVHTKTVLVTTVVLILFGASLIFILEHSHISTFRSMPLKEKILVSYFSAVTPRTAGFNTIDYSLFHPETLVLMVILMFIGASPGSTGGGVKTTTVAIFLASFWSLLRNMRDTVMFKRRIPIETVSRSLLLIMVALLLIITVTFCIIGIEHVRSLHALFEVTSAFGTVGLSIGDGGVRSLSAQFSYPGKLLICFMMFAGRLGPLTLAVAVVRRKEERFRYPEGRIIIG